MDKIKFILGASILLLVSVVAGCGDGSNGGGVTGATGPAGADGADGADGATGAQGIQGVTGSDGADGAPGATGPAGATGADGTDGADGADSTIAGPPGIDGVNGVDGADAEGPYVFMGAPQADDDINDPNEYSVGTLWVDTIGGSAYILIDNAPGSAVWKLITAQNVYAKGDTGPAGGIVFYVTDGGLHGLEAAPNDSPSALWGCRGTRINGADGTAIGTGQQNTADILAGCSKSPIAADVFTTAINGFLGWFLTSKDELSELYLNKDVVGGFLTSGYWSSSEVDGKRAWGQGFGDGSQYNNLGKNHQGRVRAIRAF